MSFTIRRALPEENGLNTARKRFFTSHSSAKTTVKAISIVSNSSQFSQLSIARLRLVRFPRGRAYQLAIPAMS